jgi:hypothetical protein
MSFPLARFHADIELCLARFGRVILDAGLLLLAAVSASSRLGCLQRIDGCQMEGHRQSGKDQLPHSAACLLPK